MTSLDFKDEYICKCRSLHCQLGILADREKTFADDTSNLLIYSGTENVVSILCASIPVIRGLWTACMYGYAESHRSYRRSSTQHLSELHLSDLERGSNRRNCASPTIETRIYAASDDGSAARKSEETILRDKVQRSVFFGEQELVCTSKMSINFSRQGRKDSDETL